MKTKSAKSFSLFVMFILPIFFAISCSTETVTGHGEAFFLKHGYLQLLGWWVFPRLMFWFFSVMTGGLWFWVGVFFVPRIMAAFWATTYYWDTNPILCVIAWLVAFSFESAEKKAVRSKSRKIR